MLFSMKAHAARMALSAALGMAVLLSLLLLLDAVALHTARLRLAAAFSSIDFREAALSGDADLLRASAFVSRREHIIDAIISADACLRKGRVDEAERNAALAVRGLEMEAAGKVQKLVTALSVLLIIALLIAADLVLQQKKNPLPVIVRELERTCSGAVPLSISCFRDVKEDTETILGYVEVLEKRRWPLALSYADEHAVPPTIEHLRESLDELGPVLDDINTQLFNLLQTHKKSPLISRKARE